MLDQRRSMLCSIYHTVGDKVTLQIIFSFDFVADTTLYAGVNKFPHTPPHGYVGDLQFRCLKNAKVPITYGTPHLMPKTHHGNPPGQTLTH